MLSLHELLDIIYGGVDHSLPGNGGPDCVSFLGHQQRLVETIGYTLFTTVLLINVLNSCSLPEKIPVSASNESSKTLLLVVVTLVFGVETGFKCASKQIIYLLNPCHILTIIQIYLLSASPSRMVMIVFRIHIHLLFGALLAVVFPVVNTRHLPFEVSIYWIQHILVLIIVPVFLLSCKGVYTPEPSWDCSWSVLTFTLFSYYMFLFLQPLGLISQVNLNNMVCPAVSDPFYGKHYRLFSMVHQPALILIYGKIFTGITLKTFDLFGACCSGKVD